MLLQVPQQCWKIESDEEIYNGISRWIQEYFGEILT
jgi:hypothetical protein